MHILMNFNNLYNILSKKIINHFPKYRTEPEETTMLTSCVKTCSHSAAVKCTLTCRPAMAGNHQSCMHPTFVDLPWRFITWYSRKVEPDTLGSKPVLHHHGCTILGQILLSIWFLICVRIPLNRIFLGAKHNACHISKWKCTFFWN